MNEQRRPDTAAEVMDALIRFVEDPEEVATMSGEQINAYLQAHGVNLEEKTRELRQRLTTIQGQARLQRAAEERRRVQPVERHPAEEATRGTGSLRAEVVRRLGFIGPQRAEAYFRKLEEATDSDLEEMLRDLEFLDTLNEAGGEETGA